MTLSPHDMERYARHIMLPQIGGAGQAKINKAKVLLVGAGGIGAPLLIYLAAAGVKTIGIADDDTIDATNLQRQILYRQRHLGKDKVTTATKEAQDINEDVTLIPHKAHIDEHNGDDIIANYDIIADGSDTMQAAYCLNKLALKQRKILIKASVSGWSGQLTTIDGSDNNAPCYECLFPQNKAQKNARGGCEQGVLNMAVCVMAGLLGAEVIKTIVGVGESLKGRLLLYDAEQSSTRIIHYEQNPHCPQCSVKKKL